VLGEDPAEGKRTKRLVPTLSNFFYERALPFAKGSGKRSWKSDVSIFKNHLEKKFGNFHLDEITHQAVIEFHHGMHEAGYAKATCNRALVLLKLLYTLSRRWQIPGAIPSPCIDIHYFEANNARQRYLTAEETKRLHAELEKSDNPQLKFIVALAILSGARKRELLDAQWKDIDLARRIWTVPLSKSGKARHIPISDAALSVFEQLPRWDGCPFVVPNPLTLKPYTSIFRTWDKARKAAGLSDVCFHSLRHSLASNLINNNVPIFEVSKILGHSSLRSTQRYSHLSNEKLLASINIAATATGVNWSQPQS
jgi:integrase